MSDLLLTYTVSRNRVVTLRQGGGAKVPGPCGAVSRVSASYALRGFQLRVTEGLIPLSAGSPFI